MSRLSATSWREYSGSNLSRRDATFLRAITVFVAIGLLILGLTSGFDHYTPDSWSYVDIARNMSVQLGLVDGVRSFGNAAWLNDSFPYFWPAFLSFSMTVLGPTVPHGMLANLFVVIPLTTAIIVFIFFPKGARFAWAGAIALLLCVIPGYMAEVLSGRSLPLSVLCLSAFVMALRSPLNRLRAISAGLFLGLIGANRFDGFLVGLTLAIAATFVLKLPWQKALILSLGVFAGQVPWIFYSLQAFGKVFVSSSAAQILTSTETGPDGYPVQRIHGNTPNLFESILEDLPRAALALTISLAPLALLILVNSFQRTTRDIRGCFQSKSLQGKRSRLWLLGAIVAAVELAQVVAAGFSDHRYFMLAVVLFTIAFIDDHVSLAANRTPKISRWTIVALLAGSLLVITGETVYKPYEKATFLSAKGAECILAVPQPSLAQGPRAYKISGLLGAQVVSAPSNSSSLSESDWRDLARKYSVRSWVTLDGDSDLPASAAAVFTIYRCKN